MIIDFDFEQGSDEWLAARLGVISGTGFAEIVSPLGKKLNSDRPQKYAAKLIDERIRQVSKSNSFKSEAMKHGNNMEPVARSFYQIATGRSLKQCGFVYKNKLRKVGCSPDSLEMLGDSLKVISRGVEIKCPDPDTHVRYLLAGECPKEYICQIQGSMYVTGCEKWDFMSYHQDYEPLIITVHRDNDFINSLEATLIPFLKMVDDGESFIKKQLETTT